MDDFKKAAKRTVENIIKSFSSKLEAQLWGDFKNLTLEELRNYQKNTTLSEIEHERLEKEIKKRGSTLYKVINETK